VRLLQFNYPKTRISFFLTKHHTPSKHPQTPGEYASLSNWRGYKRERGLKEGEAIIKQALKHFGLKPLFYFPAFFVHKLKLVAIQKHVAIQVFQNENYFLNKTPHFRQTPPNLRRVSFPLQLERD